MRDPVRWYDLVAPLYDPGTLGVYTRAREMTIGQLRLDPGQTVLDVACGTGENFKHIVAKIGPSGTLIGADYSEGMLAQAKRKLTRNKWTNVYLLHEDASTLSIGALRSALGLPELRLDRVVCSLGYSVIPNWQTAFDRTWEMLQPGGRYAIMDWYSPNRTLFTRFLSLIAVGEIDRRWWDALEQRAIDFERESLFRNMIFVVSGGKPEGE